MAENRDDHWKDIGTSTPSKDPGPYAQDRSRKPPTKQRQEDYGRAGEAGKASGDALKK